MGLFAGGDRLGFDPAILDVGGLGDAGPLALLCRMVVRPVIGREARGNMSTAPLCSPAIVWSH